MKGLPKRIAEPAKGLTVETESDRAKADRLLAMFRYMIERKTWTTGLTFKHDGAQFMIMIVRHRPQPKGPHNPDADLSGVEA